MKKFYLLYLFMLVALPVSAKPKPQTPTTTKPTCSHAICKVAGAILFTAEDGIDVVHGAFDVANRALIAAQPAKILIPVQKVVGEIDLGAAYVDTATEHAENYLFGVSN